jgi:hypothetical protein
MKKTIKTSILSIGLLLVGVQNANAQFGKKLKEALVGKPTTTETKQETNSAEKPKEIVNTYVLTDFQKSNTGKVVVFNDYLGNRLDETSADVASVTELAEHFVMRAYFDKNVRDTYKNGFDIVFSCEDVTVSVNSLRAHSNQFFLKTGGPTGKMPGILALYGSMGDLKYDKFWKNEKIFSTGLLPKKADSEYDALQYMYYPVENTFRFFLNKLSSKMAVGKSLTFKIQFMGISDAAADGWKATDAEKTVLAEGTHTIKITANTTKLNNNVYRFEDDDYMNKPALNASLQKALKMLYANEIAEVYKVQFYSDFTTKSNTYGPEYQWIKARVLLKAKSDGSFWSCKIEPHYKYNGSSFDATPFEVIFINKHLVPSVGIPGAK